MHGLRLSLIVIERTKVDITYSESIIEPIWRKFNFIKLIKPDIYGDRPSRAISN